MKKTVLVIAGLLALVAAFGFAQQRKLGELVVFNNWSSEAELGALNVIRQAFIAQGGKWKDITIAHDTGASIPLINMLTGGNPPDVFIENNVQLRRELFKQGLLHDFTAYYNSLNIDKFVPPAVKEAMMVDGKVLSAPLGIHIVGTIFWNTAAAKKVGVNPNSWKSLEEMFADFPKIRKAGLIPLAIGAQKWQLEYLLQSMLAQVSGKLYNDICGLNPNKAAIDTPEMRKALAYFRQIQKEADPGSANRNWNDTTNLVIRGEALMQLHGDWMKGEFLAAKKKIGVDFDSRLVPGANAVQVTVDEETFLKPKDATKQASIEALFKIMMDRRTTEKFSSIKGSTPIRLDAVIGVDKHAKMVLAALNKPNYGYPVSNITMDPDWKQSFQDLADTFWNTPNMTADEFIKQLQGKYDQVFKK
ncbi:MAG: ABC transporter substrate-binding protein [Meiothermus sp.]|nr:ABC transporter substrate-binding protein [Meiothermus sp.]